MEQRIRILLEQLSELLRDVISDSPEAVEKVDEIQEEGYALHLLLDCKPADEDEEDEESGDQLDGASAEADEVSDGESGLACRSDAVIDPVRSTFRINAEDLRFLRSVGIDPTRRVSSKRYRPSSESPKTD